MTRTLIRARLLTFLREPHGPDDTASFRYIEDGALLIEGGLIHAIGEFGQINAPDATIIDHRPHLVLPGFIDTHLHFPQTQVIASWAAELLDWLNDYTFPEETRYSDPDLCARMASAFLDRLTDHGTTTAVAYASVHATSAEALFAEEDTVGESRPPAVVLELFLRRGGKRLREAGVPIDGAIVLDLAHTLGEFRASRDTEALFHVPSVFYRY